MSSIWLIQEEYEDYNNDFQTRILDELGYFSDKDDADAEVKRLNDEERARVVDFAIRQRKRNWEQSSTKYREAKADYDILVAAGRTPKWPIMSDPGEWVEPDHNLIYRSSDTNRLEALGQSRRGSDSGQERHNLSLALRVVGDYLDRHRAVAFDISWVRHSVTVKYQSPAEGYKEANFTVQNLHDLGVGMFSRRPASRSAK